MAEFPDIEITRGDTPAWSYKLFGGDGEPLDLSGVTVWLTAKPVIDDDVTDAAAVIRHYLVVGQDGVVSESAGMRMGGVDPVTELVVSGPKSGVFTHEPSAEDTTVIAPGTYVYDIQTRSANGRYKTILRNQTLTVIGDVTRRTTAA